MAQSVEHILGKDEVTSSNPVSYTHLDVYKRQQWGILHNGRKPDAATPREGRRFSDCKPLF